jgi:murein endopeptidase
MRRALRTVAAALLIAGLLAPPAAAGPRRPSRALGQPWHGTLVGGVQLPASGAGFYTFDSALRVSPSRGWRRWGTDYAVVRTMTVLAEFQAAHPDGPRVAVGDLSRRHGGPFGTEFGGAGHASHQNGLDVDVYYPRLDRREKPPIRVAQVDRVLSQELVDRFVAMGASRVFVGPNVGLHGPLGVVEPLAHHDNHVHVRWPNVSTARR